MSLKDDEMLFNQLKKFDVRLAKRFNYFYSNFYDTWADSFKDEIFIYFQWRKEKRLKLYDILENEYNNIDNNFKKMWKENLRNFESIINGVHFFKENWNKRLNEIETQKDKNEIYYILINYQFKFIQKEKEIINKFKMMLRPYSEYAQKLKEQTLTEVKENIDTSNFWSIKKGIKKIKDMEKDFYYVDDKD